MIDPTAIVLAASLAIAGDPSPPTRVARGTIATFEVDHPAGPLRAKALRDGASPVLVRVNPLGGSRHLVECFGVVEGEFDLGRKLEPGVPATGALHIPACIRNRCVIHLVFGVAVRTDQPHS